MTGERAHDSISDQNAGMSSRLGVELNPPLSTSKLGGALSLVIIRILYSTSTSSSPRPFDMFNTLRPLRTRRSDIGTGRRCFVLALARNRLMSVSQIRIRLHRHRHRHATYSLYW